MTWTFEEITPGRLFRLRGPGGEEVVMQAKDAESARKIVAALNFLDAVQPTALVKTAEGKK